MTPSQCRMARAATNLSREKFCKNIGISVTTLADFEAGRREPYERTIRDIQGAFERLGVTFLAANKDGPGVRLNEE